MVGGHHKPSLFLPHPRNSPDATDNISHSYHATLRITNNYRGGLSDTAIAVHWAAGKDRKRLDALPRAMKKRGPSDIIAAIQEFFAFRDSKAVPVT